VRFSKLGHEVTGVPLGVRLHPTQLYESFAMVIVFLFLLWLHKRKKFNGQVILAYAVIYATVRFLIEFVRDDPRGDILGLTTLTGLSTSQMIGLIVGGDAGGTAIGVAPAVSRTLFGGVLGVDRRSWNKKGTAAH